MPTAADLDIPEFPYSDPDLKGDRFHEALRELRERTWLAKTGELAYFVLDKEASTFFVQHPGAIFPGRFFLEIQGITGGPLYERLKGSMLDQRGETHRRLRKLVQPTFTPKAVERFRPMIRKHIVNLYEAVADDKACDFVEAFAKPFPSLMFAEIMGAPLEDAPQLAEWARLVLSEFDPTAVADHLPLLEEAAVQLVDYTRELMEERRRNPGDDVLSELLAVEQEGDRLSADECVYLTGSLLTGGMDTTTSQLAHGCRLFANHPDQWRLLAENPSLAPQAVEEVLRFEPAAPYNARILLQDIEFRGVTFPEGTLVAAVGASANRDEDAWENPGVFDITVERGRVQQATFGAGVHYCLGAHLVRLELQDAFAYLAPRMPGLEIAGDVVFDTPLGVYHIRELPIRWR